MPVLHRTSNATRGAMAATMYHSSIRGLATAFHLFFAGLPRSEDGDHPYWMPTQNFRGFPSSFPRIALPVRWSVYRKGFSDGPPVRDVLTELNREDLLSRDGAMQEAAAAMKTSLGTLSGLKDQLTEISARLATLVNSTNDVDKVVSGCFGCD